MLIDVDEYINFAYHYLSKIINLLVLNFFYGLSELKEKLVKLNTILK